MKWPGMFCVMMGAMLWAVETKDVVYTVYTGTLSVCAFLFMIGSELEKIRRKMEETK